MTEPTDRDREMARDWLVRHGRYWSEVDRLEDENKLATLFVAARDEERERCAKIAELHDERPYEFTEYRNPGRSIAARIREGNDA